MKSISFAFVSTVRLSAIFAIVAAQGCSSGNKSYETGMKTGAELRDLAEKVETANKQIDTTLANADALTAQTSGDPRKQLETYRKSLKKLETSATDVRDLADDMQKRGEAYFAQWDKDLAKIHNEDIKAVSTQRRAERMAQFKKLQESYGKARDAFKPFMQHLRDVDQALGTELTPSNLEAMKPFVAKAKTDAVPLEAAIEGLRTQFRDLGIEMSPKAG
jgi:chromosome segregation ATPase